MHKFRVYFEVAGDQLKLDFMCDTPAQAKTLAKARYPDVAVIFHKVRRIKSG